MIDSAVSSQVNTDGKVRYFKSLWVDYLSEMVGSLRHDIFHIPLAVFSEFYEEITLNKIDNKENKKFFIEAIGKISGYNLIATNKIKDDIELIKKQYKDESFDYIKYLVKNILTKLESVNFKNDLIVELSEILTDSGKLDEKSKYKIELLTIMIVYCLRFEKYSDKRIVRMIDHIFDDYQVLDGGLCTSFPHNIQYDGSLDDLVSLASYYDNIKTMIDSLTVKDRLLCLKNYFANNKKPYTFIFSLYGLKAKEKTVKLGNVVIYSPGTKKMCNGKTSSCDETFGKEKPYFCNGAVTIDCVDFEYSKHEAASLLARAVDLLVVNMCKYEIPITICTENVMILDSGGNRVGISLENTAHILQYEKSMELASDEKYIEMLEIIANGKAVGDEFYQRISESVHWHRKAVEALNSQEKLLWSWVSIENILNDPKKVFHVMSKQISIKMVYGFAWRHYMKFYEIYTIPGFNVHRQRIRHSPKLDVLCNEEVGSIHIGQFIEVLPELIDCVEDELFKDQLVLLSKVFSNKDKCKKILLDMHKYISQQLLMIYRIRNKIMHNAYSESWPMVDYYAKLAVNYSSLILKEYIDTGVKQGAHADFVVHDMEYRFDTILQSIDKGDCGCLVRPLC